MNSPQDPVRSALDVLLGVDATQCDHAALDRLSSAAQRVRGYLAVVDARIARRRHELLSGPPPGPPPDPAPDPASGSGGAGTGEPGAPAGPLDERQLDLLATAPCDRDRRSGRATEAAATRGGMLANFPAFEEALACGRVDAEHVDGLAAGWRLLDGDTYESFAAAEEHLLGRAVALRPERFRKVCVDLARSLVADHGIAVLERQRRASSVSRWVDQATGMWHLRLGLDPERGAAIDALIQRAVDAERTAGHDDQRTFPELELAAVLRLLAGGAPEAGATERTESTVSVLIDLATLTSGEFRADSVCETAGLGGQPLPPATARRLACDAAMLPVVLGGDGVPLDVGRERRLATAGQRRALRAVHATCVHPSCDRAFEQCHIHHLVPWEQGGATDLDNLVPVCSRHHRLVHEGGWQVSLDQRRNVRWTAPDGTITGSPEPAPLPR
jgi:hypothetical protein